MTINSERIRKSERLGGHPPPGGLLRWGGIQTPRGILTPGGVICIFLITILLPWASPLEAGDRELSALFSRHKIDGTMIITSNRTRPSFIHNRSRATIRYVPASTFKILNTLIALEVGAVSGRDAIFKWDGKTGKYAAWNRDQTLESAFRVSCVWCYQELARRVGESKYRIYLRKSKYGELREPFHDTTFWLDGSLKISAAEQIEFLKKVYRRSWPFSDASYDTLRRIMRVERTPAYTLYAKTGWTGKIKPPIAWYVGYVEKGDDVWFFATNMEIRDEKKDLPLRLQLTREALRLKGILE